MGGSTLKIGSLSVSIYKRSFIGFLILGCLSVLAYLNLPKLNALDGVGNQATLYLNLLEGGELYTEKAKLSPEIFIQESSYRYRLQVVRNPQEIYDEYKIFLTLPKNIDESNIAHRFINNGGALRATSSFEGPKGLLFTAEGVSSDAQLSIEFELPKNYFVTSTRSVIRERAAALPASFWAVISIVIPVLTLLVLLVIISSRNKRVTPSPAKITVPPTNLPPAMVGILKTGRLTSRDLAATLIDLAQRGHLVIREISPSEWRFRRLYTDAKLYAYESVLLDQLFGSKGTAVTNEEISFFTAQELFSKYVTQAYTLAYQELSEYGYFAVNPAKTHKRFQLIGIVSLFLSVLGIVATLTIFQSYYYTLFFYGGCASAALLIISLSGKVSLRTALGDRELSRWLAFRRHLSSAEQIHFAAVTQQGYVAHLPYAIVLEAETEWTRRFINVPFAVPGWYLSSEPKTIERFVNDLFPLVGYLSRLMAASARPSVR